MGSWDGTGSAQGTDYPAEPAGRTAALQHGASQTVCLSGRFAGGEVTAGLLWKFLPVHSPLLCFSEQGHTGIQVSGTDMMRTGDFFFFFPHGSLFQTQVKVHFWACVHMSGCLSETETTLSVTLSH